MTEAKVESHGPFLVLLVLLAPALIACALLLRSRRNVFAGTGCLGGFLGVLLGFFGVNMLLFRLFSSGYFGRMDADSAGWATIFYGFSLGALAGVLLGRGIAALMQRGKETKELDELGAGTFRKIENLRG